MGKTTKIYDKFTKEELIEKASHFNSRIEFSKSIGISDKTVKRILEYNCLTVDFLWPDRKCNYNKSWTVKHKLDLNNEIHSYFYGFALADGNLLESTRNRGRLSIELKDTDKDILYTLSSILPWKSSILTRTRKSPYDKYIRYTTYTLKYYSYDLRQQLKSYGFPAGKKSDICSVPTSSYDEIAFWRGYIDADGTVSSDKYGCPLISLTTKSEEIKNEFCSFIFKNLKIKRCPTRNKRDNIYNISFTKLNAILLMELLYKDSIIGMNRKRNLALKFLNCQYSNAEGINFLNDKKKKLLFEEGF